MRIETKNPKVNLLLRQVIKEVDCYKDRRDFTLLTEAMEKIEGAIHDDPEFLPAIFWRGILNDLRGRAKDAISDLARVVEEQPPFGDDARYHLAVAYYHRYNLPSLEKAAELLNTILTASGDDVLSLRARAVLAQIHAMCMVHAASNLAETQRLHRAVENEFELGQKLLAGFPEGAIEKRLRNEIEGNFHNARGMSLMYSSDFVGSVEERVTLLQDALRQFTETDRLIPRDWANSCDRGSAYMRLGYWSKSASDFARALDLLSTVVSTLRPYYGFAYYELGRTHRLMGQFSKAIESFDKALAIPYEYRNVGDARLKLELEKARMGLTSCP